MPKNANLSADPVCPHASSAPCALDDADLLFGRAAEDAAGNSRGASFRPATPAMPDLSNWIEGGIAILNDRDLITAINEPFSDWLGRPASVLAGQSFWDLLIERCADWRAPIDVIRSSGQNFSEAKLRLSSQAAQWFSLECARHASGCFARLNSILPPRADLEEGAWNEHLHHDSVRRDLFIRLLRAEAQLSTLSERWPGVIFSQRADYSFRFVSPKIEALTGVPAGEWQAKPHWFWQVIHPDDAEELRQQFKQARLTGQPVATTYRLRHVQTGRITYVMEHRQPVVSRGGLLLGYEGVWLDVTRQTIAEKRLSSAAWKETLSILTMGLAHDFSNVMAGIHALSESFIEQAGEAHEFNEGLGLIKKNAQQASQLVHRIINLHQGRPGESNYHNLNELAAELADLVKKIIPRRMQFSLELAPEALPVYLDAVELRQVVINLVLNAVDAMPQAGRLVLRTDGFNEVPALPHCQGAPPRAPAARLSVQDNGCGIKPRHLPSIFDPFFTTKPVNKGSGLGLYNARLFIEKHRGAITVESAEGAGTTFHLWLPQADFTEMESRADEASSRRTLLLAGESGEALEGTAEFLRLNNYQVVTAGSPAGAFKALRSTDVTFHGAMLVAAPQDAALLALLPELRRCHPGLKLMLKLVGRDPDDVPSDVLEHLDVFIPSDLPQPRILEKIAKSF